MALLNGSRGRSIGFWGLAGASAGEEPEFPSGGRFGPSSDMEAEAFAPRSGAAGNAGAGGVPSAYPAAAYPGPDRIGLAAAATLARQPEAATSAAEQDGGTAHPAPAPAAAAAGPRRPNGLLPGPGGATVQRRPPFAGQSGISAPAPGQTGPSLTSPADRRLDGWRAEQGRLWERQRQLTRMATGMDVGPMRPHFVDPAKRMRNFAGDAVSAMSPVASKAGGQSRRGIGPAPHGREGRTAPTPLQIVRGRFVPRPQWGAQPPDLSKLLERAKTPFDTITLHHSGSRDTPQGVQNLHQGEGNWWRHPAHKLGLPVQDYGDYADVGYHFMIGRDGRIYEGRPLSYKGAHVDKHNSGNLGIVMLGDYSSKRLSGQQLDSLRNLTALLRQRYPTIRNVLTHGQFDLAKGDELVGAVDQIRPLLTNSQGYSDWRAGITKKIPRSP